MNTKSRKAKGRNLQNFVAKKLRELYDLTEADIKPAVMGEKGRDIQLSKDAEQYIDFDIECKNTETLNVWKAIEQTNSNTQKNREPLLVVKKNRDPPYAVIKFDKLLDLLHIELAYVILVDMLYQEKDIDRLMGLVGVDEDES